VGVGEIWALADGLAADVEGGVAVAGGVAMGDDVSDADDGTCETAAGVMMLTLAVGTGADVGTSMGWLSQAQPVSSRAAVSSAAYANSFFIYGSSDVFYHNEKKEEREALRRVGLLFLRAKWRRHMVRI
jgi:hypothetical protein